MTDLQSIGTVVNSVRDAGDSGWGQVVSEIRLRPELAAGLAGLDGFSHVVVVYLMHQARFEPGEHLVRRSRDRADMPLLGIFAQRATSAESYWGDDRKARASRGRFDLGARA